MRFLVKIIASDKVKTRATALTRLHNALENEANRASLQNEKLCIDLLLNIGEGIRLDVNIYAKHNSSLSSSGRDPNSASRIQSYGDAVKKICELQLQRFRPKTVKVLLEHVIMKNRFPEPLLFPFSKVCLALANSSAHLEHLSTDLWTKFITFITKWLQIVANTSGSSKKLPPIAITDLVHAVYALLKNNARAQPKAFPEIFSNLIHYLEAFPFELGGHAHLIASMGLIVNRLVLIDPLQSFQFAAKTLRLIPKLMGCKGQDLKMQIPLFILYCIRSLEWVPNAIDLEERRDLLSSVEALQKQFTITFLQPHHGSLLRPSDVFLISSNPGGNTWFQLRNFQLDAKGDQLAWLTVLAGAELLRINVMLEKHSTEDGPQNAHKKQKLLGESSLFDSSPVVSSPWTKIMQNLESIEHFIPTIQVLVFLLEKDYIESDDPELDHLAGILLSQSRSNTSEAVFWSLLGLVSLARQNLLSQDQVDNLSKICRQRLFDPELGSLSAFCLSLVSHRISASDFTETVQMYEPQSPKYSIGSLLLYKALLSEGKVPHSTKALAVKRLTVWIIESWKHSVTDQRKGPSFFHSIETAPYLLEALLIYCGIDHVELTLQSSQYGPLAEANLVHGFYTEAWGVVQPKSQHSSTLSTSSGTKGLSNSSDMSPSRCEKLIQEIDYYFSNLHGVLLENTPVTVSNLHSMVLCYLFCSSLPQLGGDLQSKIALVKSSFLFALEQASAGRFPRALRGDLISACELIIRFHRKSVDASIDDWGAQVLRFFLKLLNDMSSIDEGIGDLDLDSNERLLHNWTEVESSNHLRSLTSKTWLETITNSAPIGQQLTAFEHAITLTHLDGSLTCNSSEEDAVARLRETGKHILQSYELQASELGVLAGINVLDSYRSLWLDADSSESLRMDARDILSWILRLVLDMSLQSEIVRIRLTSLMMQVAVSKVDYNLAHAPSDVIAKLAASSDGLTLYVCSQCLEPLFSGLDPDGRQLVYPLVLDSLGQIDQNPAHLAFRALALVQMGIGGVNTPMTTFNLLEIAARSPDYPFVQRALDRLSGFFNFESVKDFFVSVSKPVLYYWLYYGFALQEFPFHVFGFESTEEFIGFSLPEIVAQMLVHYRNDSMEHLEWLQNYVDLSINDIISHGFYKAIAYGFTDNGDDYPMDQVVVSIIGHEEFMELLRSQLANIVSEMFDLLQFGTAQYASKSPRYSAVFGSSTLSTTVHDPFNPELVQRTIESLCSLCGISARDLWTPSTFRLVLRRIFNSTTEKSSPLEKSTCLRRCVVLFDSVGDVSDMGYGILLSARAVGELISSDAPLNELFKVFQIICPECEKALNSGSGWILECTFQILYKCTVILKEKESLPTDSAMRETILVFLIWLAEYVSTSASGNAARIFEKLVGYLCDHRDENIITDQELASLILDDVLSLRLKGYFLGCLAYQLENANDLGLGLLSQCSSLETISRKLLDIPEFFHSRALKDWILRTLGRTYLSAGPLTLENVECRKFLFDSALKKYTPADRPVIALLKLVENGIWEGDFSSASYFEESARRLVSDSSSHITSLALKKWSQNIVSAVKSNFLKVLEVDKPPSNIQEMGSYSWIRGICMEILSSLSGSLGGLSAVVPYVPGFEAKVFPYLAHASVLTDGGKTRIENIVHETLSNDNCHKDIQKLVIETVYYLRYQGLVERQQTSDPVVIDLGQVAKAASRVGMFKSALMAIELQWGHGMISTEVPLLSEIYQNIDDPDIKYGYQRPASLQEVVNDLKGDQWSTISYESAKYDWDSKEADVDSTPLASSLDRAGMHGLAKLVLENQGSGMYDDQRTTAWKLQQWDLPEGPAGFQNFGSFAFKLFKRIRESQTTDRNTEVVLSAYNEISDLFFGNYTQAADSTEILKSLGAIVEAEEALRCHPNEIPSLIELQRQRSGKWIRESRYAECEDVLVSRETLWGLLEDSQEDAVSETRGARGLCLLDICRQARDGGDVHRALSGVIKLDSVTSSPKTALDRRLKLAATIESAKAVWDMQNQSSAIQILSKVLEDTSVFERESFRYEFFHPSEIYALLAIWSSQARQEDGAAIAVKYLDPAVEIISGAEYSEKHFQRAQVFHTYAEFCSQQQGQLRRSEDIENLKKMIARNEKEVAALKQMDVNGKSSKKVNEHLTTIQKILDNDRREYQRLVQEQAGFLETSVAYYLKCIAESDDYPTDISKFFALWLSHSSDDGVNKRVKRNVGSVPSIKFVPWINQLTARLSADIEEYFQKVLWTLMVRICNDHPYHSLYQVMSLRMLHSNTNMVLKSRARAGEKFWSYVRKNVGTNDITNIGTICTRAVELARSEVAKGVKKMSLSELDSSQHDFWHRQLSKLRLPSPTQTIEPRSSCDYSDVPRIYTVGKQIDIASGNSRPKVLSYTTDDGENHKMLIKGHDDMRQDAIMQQVFDQVNAFFKRDERTRTRKLSIRTYKVVPLGHSAGIIEFIKNSIALNDSLVHAHEKYYPKDWKSQQCRQLMVKNQYQSARQRIKVYNEITEHVHPALRHFFFDSFHSPDHWFTSRTNYSRSTASISILGHILGLGDRHCNNILIDSAVGEVVHIDFGYAFDQGRSLPIPETVPFRLTRDVVDGMGISGVEGIFRRCCECSLSVLRKEAESILTILNVLRYDPLYKWTVSPVKKQKKQANDESNYTDVDVDEDDDDSQAAEAIRALAGVSRKLSDNLHPEAVVRELIFEATLPDNLALLFGGWSPFY
uniref:Serine/threonine-protein kinase Tel1 n=1 Tax=Blastobotrys adeninivorans TaxID=409370 RepID=A0A060TA48_BLAAD